MENIKRFLIVLSLAGWMAAGCSSSETASGEDYLTETAVEESTESADTTGTEPATREPRQTAAQQRFNVQADTLTVQSRKKENTVPPPVSAAKASPGKKFYSVQIGAFRLKSNAERNVALLKKRFPQPVIKFFESGIKMERVCVGHFATIKEAGTFLRSIQKQYPKDYQDAWIAGLKR